MARRTINSPGVEIFERDLSLRIPQNIGTNVFVTGFTNQGPTDEVLKVTTRDELEQIYGVPTNSSERYFYYTVRELLNSPANIYTFRLPYGENTGDGFGSQYSALVYPVRNYAGSSVFSVSSFEVSLNYSPTLSANPLSGAAFSFQTSDNIQRTVVYSINGAAPARTGDIVINVNSNDDFTNIISKTTAAIALSAAGQIEVSFLPTTSTSFTINLSSYVPYNFTASTSASVLPGLDDPGDVFGITASTISVDTGVGLTNNLDTAQGSYFLGEPVHFNLNETEYRQALEGSLFDWSTTSADVSGLSALNALGGAGVIVLNKAQTTINGQFEGYYLGIADNTNINPATDYDAVLSLKTVSTNANRIVGASYTNVPNGTLQFNLSSTSLEGSNSISEIMENLTDYDIDDAQDDDLLNIGVFKIRKSLYANESFKLDFVLDDAIVGSIDTFRTQLNPRGGPAIPFFLESVDNNSRNIEILVNPYISNKFRESSLNAEGIPQKKIRVLTNGIISNYSNISASVGIPLATLQSLSGIIGFADNLYPLGAFSDTVITQKIVGNIPTKINRALETIKNDEVYDIDVVVEGGLGTIFAMACAAGTPYYDDTLYSSTLNSKLSSLRTSNDIFNIPAATEIRGNYSAIFNQFENFCNLPSNTGGRGDCMFIADILRHIVVTGKNTKILSDKTKNFQLDVYWPIRHQFGLENTSYAAVYGNWVQVYEEFSGEKIWVPFSGYAAATYARTDANDFPWIAPAGFNRGLLTTSALDIAVNPNQKQRDEFYKTNINPVSFSASDGMVIIGQKTLSRKPSAFDRINVRRLFLALERPTKKVSKYFLFEPNTEFTRTRYINTLTPLFEFAKQNEGLYDYLIVVDERNNTPEVIDNNELRADIFIKPVRAAEFILVQFTATRTDASFQELI
jgi:hypothetical protein